MSRAMRRNARRVSIASLRLATARIRSVTRLLFTFGEVTAAGAWACATDSSATARGAGGPPAEGFRGFGSRLE
jgi:hypothetical protein